jgi:ABC-type polysaccharide/polyol phosphate export permease
VISDLRQLFAKRELLYMLTWRDIRIRYKQSVMGILWAVLMPSLIVGAGVLVRVAAAKFTGKQIQHDDIESVMVRAVAWAFFIGAIRFGTNSLISNPNLVTKIAFPKEVFPLASVLSNLFDFSVAALAVVLALVLFGWTPPLEALWVVPLMLLLIALATALTLILSAANLFFRDVKYLVEVFLTYAIFVTPVLFDVAILGRLKNVVMLNPISPILEGLADTVVYGRMPDPSWTLYSCAVTAVLLIGGYWLFKQLEQRFAESI